MRYDSFIIWGNGIAHTDEILDMIIRKYKVLFIQDITFDNMQDFLDKVYECDNVPKQHITAKSRYLMNAPKKAVYILIENHEPNEEFVGDGTFRHIQCINLREFKFSVRAKFNPPHSNPNFHVHPLPKGISHDHVLHSTDYESQVHFLNNLFGYPKIERTKLDVMKFFIDMPEYCIIRKSDFFPMYHSYKDVDFLVRDKEAVKQHIINVSKTVPWEGEIRVRDVSDNQTHIDFHLPDGSLDFKFDIYNKLDYNFIDENMSDIVLNSKIQQNKIFTPNEEYDRKIKGWEFKKFPSKTKYSGYSRYI